MRKKREKIEELTRQLEELQEKHDNLRAEMDRACVNWDIICDKFKEEIRQRQEQVRSLEKNILNYKEDPNLEYLARENRTLHKINKDLRKNFREYTSLCKLCKTATDPAPQSPCIEVVQKGNHVAFKFTVFTDKDGKVLIDPPESPLKDIFGNLPPFEINKDAFLRP